MTNQPDPAAMPDEEVKAPPPSTEKPQDAPVEQPDEEEAKPEEKAEAETEPEEPEEPETPRKKSGYARLKARHEALIAQYENLQREKTAGPEAPREPKPEDFNGDYLAYEKASVAFAAQQAIRQELAAARQQDFQSKEAEAHQDAIADFVEEAKTYSKKFPDFDQVIDQMYGSLGPLPNVLRDLIAEADNGHMVLYQMAKNPSLAREIYGEGPIGAAMKIGELNAKVSLLPARTQSKAPPPINPPRGGASPPKDFYQLAAKSESIDDYVRARRADMKSRPRED